MDHFEITCRENEWRIEGFPNAVKVIRITGPKGRRLADLALHKADLDFALECLAAINHQPGDSYVTRQAFWRSAIVHFMKCFGRNVSRFSLDAKKVYKSDDDADEAFAFFSSLRSKHVVHDENSYAQCLPGAVLNKDGSDCKIAKIVCLGVIGDTLCQGTYNNLHLLSTRAREWVAAQFDELCAIVTAELESKAYDDLLAEDGMNYTPPAASDMHTGRPVF
jgi:hypothetical protein